MKTNHAKKRISASMLTTEAMEEKIAAMFAQQLNMFEEQITSMASEMQHKLANELTQKLSEQLLGAIGANSAFKDAFAKNMQQITSSLIGRL